MTAHRGPNMKVFVAGATGTLGLPLVRALVALKHQVTGLTRSAEKRSMLEELGAVAEFRMQFAPLLVRRAGIARR